MKSQKHNGGKLRQSDIQDKNFYIQVKGKKRYFETIEAANTACQEVFEKTGIILGIIPVR